MADHVINILRMEGDSQMIRKLKEQVKQERYGTGSLDFQKIVPMPDDLMITHGSITKQCMNLFLTAVNPDSDCSICEKMETAKFQSILEKLRGKSELGAHDPLLSKEELLDLYTLNMGVDGLYSLQDMLKRGEQAVKNVLDYGHITWYHWRFENWGTPKNSFGYERVLQGSGAEHEIMFQTDWCSADPIIRKLSDQYPDLLFEYQSAKLCPGACLDQKVFKAGKELSEDELEALQSEQPEETLIAPDMM